MSQQIQITGGAKVRDLQDVIIGSSGVLSSLAFDVANGVPKLDSNGKILVSQLPNSVMEYKGTWNAATNTPTLANGTGNQGDVYLCNVAGTVDFGAGPIAFVVGDQVIYSGSIWQRASGATGTVTSVAVTESGDSLNITGSPITTSGTINIGFNGTNLQYVNGAGNLTTFPTLITSIGLSMPSAFSVSNSPLTANGTIAVTGAGVASQYIRGDGTLANFPTSGGGGSSVAYYFNSSVSQGTLGGVAYRELSKVPIIGAGTDITIATNGYIANYITDAGDPSLLEIPAGNWNFEMFFNASSNGGSPSFYVELYKYDGTTFTLISSSSATPEGITNGTAIDLYTTALAVPLTTLTLTDRLAIRVYVNNSGRTITLHTENSHLCEVITTFSTGIAALNGLTAQVQYFQVGTSGTDFNISSTTATHTFNIPDASATARGLITTGTQTIAGTKTFSDATKNNGGIFLQNASSSSLAGYMNLGGLTNGVKFTSGGGISNTFTLPSATGYTFTFPNATGTIALTSDISYPVTSVFGRTGAVVATSGDYTTAQVTESGNLYFTDSRARLALSFAAGMGAYNSATGVITIPTNNNQITNGSNYIALTSLSVVGPLLYDNTTGVFNINQASTTVSGWLSFTDFNTFNDKQTALNGTGFVKASGTTISYDNSTYLTTSSAASTYLALSGGTMTGQIVLKESSSSADYTKGLRFPNDPFGGGGDTSGLRLYASSGENIVLELYVGNDGGSDTINFATGVGGTANNDAVTINGNKIWNAANLTPQTQLSGTGFVKASGTTISYDNSTYYLASNPSSFITLTSLSVTGPLTYNNTTGAFNINKSSSTVSGWLSFDDWTTFNNKQGTITLTTTGTSGAATFSANTLNIPNYGSALSGYLPLTGGTLTGALSGTSATFSDLVTTTSVFRLTQASVARGGLYTYKDVVGSGTDYSVGIYSEGEAFIVTGGTTTKRLTIASTGEATFSSTTRVNGGISTIYNTSEARLNLNTEPDGEQTTGWLYSNNDVTLGSTGIVKIQALGTDTLSILNFQNFANNTATSFGGNVYIGTSVAQGINIGAGLSLGGWTTSTGGASVFGRIVGRKENATSSNTAGYLSFETANASPNQTSEKVRITSTGLFGIGCTPNFIFDVETSSLTVGRFFSNATGKRNNILIQNSTNYNYGVIGVVSSTGSSNGDVYGLGYSASGSAAFTEVLKWTSGGIVGIGDGGNASFKLSVTGTGGGVIANSSGAGDANFLSNSNSIGKHFLGLSGASTVFYVIQGGGVYSTSATITLITSDRNLKTDIVDYDKGLSEVLAMKPRYYKYKENLHKQEIGFIAQEMDEALKGSMIDSIMKNEKTNENYKTYQLEWYPLLVNAIKEQQKQIEELKLKIK